jgi:hypothetical protein
MGGPGSGARLHWWRPEKKETVEGCLSLDVNALMREGVLRAGALVRGNCQWEPRGGEPFALEIDADLRQEGQQGMTLCHRARDDEDKTEWPLYAVDLVSTAPHFGGLRWWFLCPLIVDGVPCRRRVGKLYLPPRADYFGCRRCHDLTYTSSQEAHGDAVLRRVAANLGCSLREVQRALRRG